MKLVINVENINEYKNVPVKAAKAYGKRKSNFVHSSFRRKMEVSCQFQAPLRLTPVEKTSPQAQYSREQYTGWAERPI
jgi:hypothetical protein